MLTIDSQEIILKKMEIQMILHYSITLYFKYVKYKIVSTFAFVAVFYVLVMSHIKPPDVLVSFYFSQCKKMAD